MTDPDDVANADVTRPVRDLGVSFIELLVAIVLLGTSGVAVLVSMSAAAVGARTSDEIADIQSVLAEAAVMTADTDPETVPYVPCDAGTDVAASYRTVLQTALVASGRGLIDVTAVRFWDPITESFSDVCAYADGARLQEVELVASYRDVSRSVRVVKRPLSAPTAGLGSVPPAPVDPVDPGPVEIEITPGIDG